MKKTISLALTAAMALSVSVCSASAQNALPGNALQTNAPAMQLRMSDAQMDRFIAEHGCGPDDMPYDGQDSSE